MKRSINAEYFNALSIARHSIGAPVPNGRTDISLSRNACNFIAALAFRGNPNALGAICD